MSRKLNSSLTLHLHQFWWLTVRIGPEIDLSGCGTLTDHEVQPLSLLQPSQHKSNIGYCQHTATHLNSRDVHYALQHISNTTTRRSHWYFGVAAYVFASRHSGISNRVLVARVKKIIAQDEDIAQCSNGAAFAISVATVSFKPRRKRSSLSQHDADTCPD